MPLMIEAFPLCWPTHKPRTPAMARKRANFSTANKGAQYASRKQLSVYEATRRVLIELEKYKNVGKPIRVPQASIIISTNIPVKRDGLPYRVAVYFSLDNKSYCLPCDKWDRVADNLAAVAAHLNAMRGIERWGVGDSHDVYTGFKALPEVTEAENDIWLILGLNVKPDDAEVVKLAYRNKAKVLHPDMENGDEVAFNTLNESYRKALLFYPNSTN